MGLCDNKRYFWLLGHIKACYPVTVGQLCDFALDQIPGVNAENVLALVCDFILLARDRQTIETNGIEIDLPT